MLYAVTAATSKKWIEVKMKELGVTSNAKYRLCMMLDDLAMITVDTPAYGVIQANSPLIVRIKAHINLQGDRLSGKPGIARKFDN